MLKNFFWLSIPTGKIIFRDLIKDKVYTSISILGLSAGITVSIIIIAINFTFLTFDKFHEKRDRIYQAFLKENYLKAGVDYGSTTPYTLGEVLKNDYPEVADAVTVMEEAGVIFIVDDNKFEQKGCYAEESLFRIFSFPVITKSTDDIFVDNNSIAISKSIAEKYFGSVFNAVDKRITLRRANSKKEVYVKAVFEDVPDNSTLKFEYVLPLQAKIDEWSRLKNWPWGNFVAKTYVELKPNVNPADLNQKVKNIISERNPFAKKSEVFLYKYEDIFIKNPEGADRSSSVFYQFIIAFVILSIAAINFINLATSRAAKKSKEIGLRKVVGADRKSLIFRFLTEAFILSLVAVLIGLFLVELLIPYINNSFNGFLILSIPFDNNYFVFSLFALWIIVSILSGLYPSIYLSALSPAGILKGAVQSKRRIFGSKTLITAQFVFSTIFIFIAVVVFKQMKFITEKDLGMNIDQVIEFNLTGEIEKHRNAFVHDLKLKPDIKDVTFANFEPMGIGSSTSDPKWEGKPEGMNDMFPILTVGENFLKTFDIKLSKGRDFIDGDSLDNNNYIINESMAKIIGKENPVGLGLSFWGNHGQIIGVVKNYNNVTLHQNIRPMVIRRNIQESNYCFVKFNPDKLTQVLSYVEKTYSIYEKEYPFQYSFLDDQFLKRHNDVTIMFDFFTLFSAIAVIISCLGLFGLTAFTIQQKTKEVGIRKVLGASVNSIAMLLTKSVIKLVVIASVIALPMGYYLSGFLLQMFVYKTDIGFGVYAISILTVFALASATVIFQALKAAAANPVESLKYE